MSHPFPSEQWTTAYKDAVNANAAYRVAGKDWTFGPVAFVVSKEPEKGIPEDVGMILDVGGGEGVAQDVRHPLLALAAVRSDRRR